MTIFISFTVPYYLDVCVCGGGGGCNNHFNKVPTEQVEATTVKQPVVIKRKGLFSRVTKCTRITARPDLIGIWKYHILRLIFHVIALFYVDIKNTDISIIA